MEIGDNSGVARRWKRPTTPHHNALLGGSHVMAIEQFISTSVCGCGCGRAVTAGRLFVFGHQNRKDNVPYRELGGHASRVRVHRLRAERALGKPLPPGAEVHHADGSKSEHAPLVICQDHAYHFLLHNRMKVKAAGGNPNTDKVCAGCKKPKPFADFYKNKVGLYGLGPHCKACHNEAARRRYAKSKATRPSAGCG